MKLKGGAILRVLIGVIGVLLIALQGVSAQDQPMFHIGVLDDDLGAISNGARLAMREINDAGGVTGADGTTFMLDLVIASPNSGLTFDDAVQTLTDANVVAVLGPQTSDQVINGMEQLQRLDVPVITPAMDDTIITSDASDLLFRSRAQEAVQEQALANYLIGEFNLTPVATVQLDASSSGAVIDFTTSANSLGVTPNPAILVQSPNDVDSAVADLRDANPAVIVAFGDPVLASTLYSDLRSQAWTGLFAYNQAFDSTFRNSVPFDELHGIIAATTWAFTSTDPTSQNFLDGFIRTYGEVPGAVEAASYDSLKLIVNALEQPGNLRDNLANAPETGGVQGTLNANDLGAGDLSNNVDIVRVGELGAPEVLAHYQGTQRLPDSLPLATATPEPAVAGQPVVLTVKQALQNVRMGPGENYDVIGQMSQGQQAMVIGTNPDRTWVMITYRNQQGWLLANVLDLAGDLQSIPVVGEQPVEPTLEIPATPTTVPQIDLIIVSASVTPNPIVPNQNFTVNITVGNIGNAPAGQFAVAGTFPPNNVYLVGTVPGLGAGQSTTLALSGILSGSGTYTASLTIDANNQVTESVVGEQNNVYNVTYNLDIGVLNQGSATLNLGDTLDLEGNAVQGDVNWNNNDGNLGLKAIFGSHLGLLGSADYNAVNYQLINPSALTRNSISRGELNPGTLVGIITADGHRGLMQVTAVSDTQISVNYRVYNG